MTLQVLQLGAARDAKGAVYVEFLVAFLPLFTFFMALVQLAYVEVADTVVKHSAASAARAASVIVADEPGAYDGEPPYTLGRNRRLAIESAAAQRLFALGRNPLTGTGGALRISFPSSEGSSDDRRVFQPSDTIGVRIEFDYPCRIPLGNRLVCGLLGRTKTLVGYAELPVQGAYYEYEGGEHGS